MMDVGPALVRTGDHEAVAETVVTPQRHLLGTTSASGVHGSGGVNLLVTPEGCVLAWGSNVMAGSLGQGAPAATLASLALPTAVKDADEPPRVLRRLQLLRRWSHEEIDQVLA